jgi:hypothetical protein
MLRASYEHINMFRSNPILELGLASIIFLSLSNTCTTDTILAYRQWLTESVRMKDLQMQPMSRNDTIYR